MTPWQERKKLQAEFDQLKRERNWKRCAGDLKDWENAWYFAKIRDLEGKLKINQACRRSHHGTSNR